MKIGVFGDSFADWRCKEIWWKFLADEHNHDVECFGQAGSSLDFSARQICDRYQHFDMIIWCVTSPNRVSFIHENQWYHVTGRHSRTRQSQQQSAWLDDFAAVQEKIDIAESFINRVYTWIQGDWIGRCILEYTQSKVPNLMIIPCFPTPVYMDANAVGFNLFKLCTIESEAYFPGQNIADVYDRYQDMRQGHLTLSNHIILSNLINENLKPGIFNVDYKVFVLPTEPLQTVYRKL